MCGALLDDGVDESNDFVAERLAGAFLFGQLCERTDEVGLDADAALFSIVSEGVGGGGSLSSEALDVQDESSQPVWVGAVYLAGLVAAPLGEVEVRQVREDLGRDAECVARPLVVAGEVVDGPYR
jgi:hypothetical protein